MEENLTRYIWSHTRRQQIWVLLVVLASMIPYYMAFDLPKQIVNGPIQGEGFPDAQAHQLFLRWAVDLPLIGKLEILPGIELDRIGMLIALSGAFLALVIVNGWFKLYINTYKGRMGERLLRRIRYQLIDRILRFPPFQFRRLKAAEAASMIKDEVEPLGGFTGDAFVQPVMLGGQALAAMVFIFAQSLWLGSIAFGIAAVQVVIIPRMRRRLIRLGRERQLTARQLSGRVNEIIDGITTVHALDTSNYERADMADRLGTIFRIRYELYQWKFMVKFLNNFLAQVTPFVFYLMGGWLTIRGNLDVGQLVAVINAYKELPGPLKELIDWDQSRQDVEVKFEQVMEQFHVAELIPEAVQKMSPGVTRLPGTIEAHDLVIEDEGGNRMLDHANFALGRGETVAFVDDLGQGAEALAGALGRAIWPVSGRLVAGGQSLFELPEAITGRQISYVPAEGYFFYGSLLDNLLYGLRHAPERPPSRSAKAVQARLWAEAEAKAAGNVTFDPEADWIDTATIPVNESGARDLADAVMAALTVTQLEDDVLDFGLLSKLDPQERPDLAQKIIEIRHAFRSEIDAGKLKNFIVPFERDRYNEEATIAENLLFGTLEDPLGHGSRIIQSPEVRDILRRLGLSSDLFDLGLDMAETIVELLGEDGGEHDQLLNDLPFLDPEELPMLRTDLARNKKGGYALATPDTRLRLIRMTLFYIEPVQRFGLMTAGLMQKIVRARHEIHERMSPALRAMIEPYDPMSYMRSATLMENILFGKTRERNPAMRQAVRSAVLREVDAARLRRKIVQIGLGHNIGVGGRRLSVAQRQRLNIARVLIRDSEYYVFNKSLSAVDPRTQEAIVADVLRLIRERGGDASVLWVLTNTRLAHLFERVVLFDHGRIMEDGEYDKIAERQVGEGALIFT